MRTRGAILALALGVVAELGAPSASSAQSRSRNPTTEEYIAELKALIAEIEVEKKVALFARDPDGEVRPFIVNRDFVGFQAQWMILTGKIGPSDIPEWTLQQLARSKRYLETLKRALAALEAGQPLDDDAFAGSPPTPGAAAEPLRWPVPMDWTKVASYVTGTYSVECKGDPRHGYSARAAGTFRLELLGDGTVTGHFDNTPTSMYRVEKGVIRADGTASGEAKTTVRHQPEIRWAARFERTPGSAAAGDDELRLSQGTVNLVPSQDLLVLVNCETGTLTPAQN